MRLIAKKPCRFGGKDFFINDQIPEELVLDAEEKEKIGLISIIKDAEAVETLSLIHISEPTRPY